MTANNRYTIQLFSNVVQYIKVSAVFTADQLFTMAGLPSLHTPTTVVAVDTGTNQYLYLNGVRLFYEGALITEVIDPTNVTLGAQWGTTNGMTGRIRRVGFIGRAITPAEVAEIHQQWSGG